MNRTILTAAGAKKIIEKVWRENDCPVDIVLKNTGKSYDSIVNLFNAKFYTYQTSAEYSNILYALVQTISPEESIPILGVDYNEKNLKITFYVQDYKADALEYYIKKLRSKYLGTVETFEVNGKSLKCYLTFGVLTYDRQPELGQSGESIVCSCTLRITYTTNVTLSDSEVYLLDGVKLPYMSGGAEVNRIGMTNDIHGSKTTQTLTTSQTRAYRFSLPYITTNEACVGLKRDILSGDLDKEYTLTHYDGITYTQDSPLEVKVTLFQTAADRVRVASASEFEVIFVEADDQSKSAMRYEMALIDWIFDMGSANTRRFNSVEEQTAYFDEKVANGGAPYAKIKAPNINSLFISSQVYINDEKNYSSGVAPLDLNSILNKNYAIIKAIDVASSEVKYTYYYYVQSARAGAGNRAVLDLRLDSIQTYLFDPNLEIAPCIINKAHLDRFEKNIENGYVSYNLSNDSVLYKREAYQNLAMCMENRRPIYLCIDENSINNNRLSPLDQWLKDNIKNWTYVYCKYRYVKQRFIDKKFLNIKGSEFGLVCFCYPVYKGKNVIKRLNILPNLSDPNNHTVNASNFWKDIERTDYPSTADILSVKTSIRPPFNLAAYAEYVDGSEYNDYLINAGNLYLYKMIPAYPDNPYDPDFQFSESDTKSGAVFDRASYPRDDSSTEFLLKSLIIQKYSNTDSYPTMNYTFTWHGRTTFDLNNIINSKRHRRLNPKLLSSDFRSLSLESMDGQRFDYDFLKLAKSTVRLIYSEALSPDITRGYLRIVNDGKNLDMYGTYMDSNFTGLIYSIDNSMPFLSTQYAEWIANNKNFFLQAQMQKDFSIKQAMIGKASNFIGGSIGLAGSVATGNPVGMAASAIGLGSGAANSAMSLESANLSYKMQMLSVDNLRAAPNMIKNASGNMYFIDSITNQQLYICEYAAIDADLNEADNDMYMNGYTYNLLGKIKDFLYTRKYFNAIAAELDSIGGVSMSEDIRSDIKSRFSVGIRFWSSDTIQYDMENYEVYLEF